MHWLNYISAEERNFHNIFVWKCARKPEEKPDGPDVNITILAFNLVKYHHMEYRTSYFSIKYIGYVSQVEANECSGRKPFSISFDDWEEGKAIDKSEGVVNRKRKLSTLRIAFGFQHLKDKTNVDFFSNRFINPHHFFPNLNSNCSDVLDPGTS